MSQKRGKWTESNMKFALNAVLLENCSLREASKKFDVPKSTLGVRIKQLKSGQEINLAPYTGDYERTFSDSEEKILFDHIVSQSKPLTKGEFLKLSYQYAEHIQVKHRFNKDKQMAGKGFYYNFMKRHSSLKPRTTKSTSLLQMSNFYKTKCYDFFKFSEFMKKYNFSDKTLSEVNIWLGEHFIVPRKIPISVSQTESERLSIIAFAGSSA